MPKIIENVREQLLCEARRQIAENGYKNTTIRSVAGACNLGIGTVYNYFKSKDILIATFILEDWQECISQMQQESLAHPGCCLKTVYDSLSNFMSGHKELFGDSDATKVFATTFAQRHKLLRDQLVDIIRPICHNAAVNNNDFLAEFIAESLLNWTVAGKTFEDISSVLNLIII